MIGTLTLVGAALVGCSGGATADAGAETVATSPPPTPVAGGHLVYGIEADPNGLDPSKNAWDVPGLQLANALYDPLVAIDAQGQPQPYLAESFTSSADYKTWTIKLRPNIVFSNNDPLDADAVVAWSKFMRDSLLTGPPFRTISDVKRVDDLTVQITTSRPWATLPMLLAGQGGYVVSPKQMTDERGSENPIGTGPFTLKKWSENQKFELAKNPRYWRAGLPYLDSVDFVVIPDAKRRIEQLVAGDLDVIAVSAEWDNRRLDELVADPAIADRISVQRDESDSEKEFVAFNMSRPPLNDVRVRQAIAYATDLAALTEDMGWSPDRRAEGPLSPGSPYFSPQPYPPYAPDKARQLIQEYLQDRRIPNRPREIAFRFVVTDVEASLGHRLVEQWKRVGINAELDLQDTKQMVRFAVMGEYGAIALRYFSAIDPDTLWHFFVDETVDDTGFTLNFTRMRDKAITAGMNDGRATLDPAARKEAYARVQQGFLDAMPYLWLARSEWRVASTSRVHDARSVTLPDGKPALPLMSGSHRLTETWLER